MATQPQEYLTRDQLVEFLNARGFPVKKHAFHKLAQPSVGQGPPIAGYWGKRPLYRPDTSLKWARARLRPAPTSAANDAA
jgi:hypothetical protein